MGGIMARDPASTAADENYVFVVLGADLNDLSTEYKSTAASVSDYQGPTYPNPDAELRLCRLGETFQLLVRPVSGGTWQELHTYTRPTMPATLQVGPIGYNNNPTPDVQATFDDVTFAPVTALSDCTAD
jgi:hypothetical protein